MIVVSSLFDPRRCFIVLTLMFAALLTACGGGGNGSGDGAPAIPVVSVGPVSVSATVGTSATFSVTASGVNLTYQWQVRVSASGVFADIAGATAATYVIATVDASMNGSQYQAVVSGPGGTATSSPATLTVAPDTVAPAITVQPTDQTALAGQVAQFSVTATGSTPSYQWQLSSDAGANYTDIAGANDASYSIAATATADNGKRFRVVISNSAGNVTSAAAVLTVGTGSAPVISIQPAPAAAYTTVTDFGAPHTATFSSGATGTPTPSYQWQVSIDGGSTFTDIAGAVAANYTTSAVRTSDNNSQFRFVATNALGVAHSLAANLTVANIGTGLSTAGLAVSQSGDIYASGMEFDPTGNQGTFAGQYMGVRVVHPSGTVTTLAGGGDTDGLDHDGTGSAARLYVPQAIALDAAGNAYVPDLGNRVRKITSSGVVTTLAGGDAQGGFDNGNGLSATFRFSSNGLQVGIALDAADNVYVTDTGNFAIRKISPAGNVSTLAGGVHGFADGTGTAAQFTNPRATAIDSAGNLYVIDSRNAGNSVCSIRKVTPGGAVTTITQGANGNSCDVTPVDGPIATAKFAYPSSIAVDGAGNIYVSEDVGGVRKITPAGVVSTLPGVKKGALTVDAAGNLYVSLNNTMFLAGGGGAKAVSAVIQKVTPAGVVTVLP
jgi:hypothetical protein